MPALGFKLDAPPAEDIKAFAQRLERCSLDEFWVCEDMGLAGGIAQSTVALAATSRLRVGLGVAPAAVRNPAYLAMEFAALARMFPHRFLGGIGHGLPKWLTQVGQHPASLMTCLSEVTRTVADLLAGKTVTFAGQHVNLDAVALTHPPTTAPPLSLGVRGPKGIRLARDLGVGVILAEGSTPDYVASVRSALGPDAPITVFAWSHLDPDDPDSAIQALRPTVRAALNNPAMAAQLGSLYRTECNSETIGTLTVSGDIARCVDALRRLIDSGADTIVLQPLRNEEVAQLELFARKQLAALL